MTSPLSSTGASPRTGCSRTRTASSLARLHSCSIWVPRRSRLQTSHRSSRAAPSPGCRRGGEPEAANQLGARLLCAARHPGQARHLCRVPPGRAPHPSPLLQPPAPTGPPPLFSTHVHTRLGDRRSRRASPPRPASAGRHRMCSTCRPSAATARARSETSLKSRSGACGRAQTLLSRPRIQLSSGGALLVARSRASGPLGAVLSSPALGVRLPTALHVLQVPLLRAFRRLATARPRGPTAVARGVGAAGVRLNIASTARTCGVHEQRASSCRLEADTPAVCHSASAPQSIFSTLVHMHLLTSIGGSASPGGGARREGDESVCTLVLWVRR